MGDWYSYPNSTNAGTVSDLFLKYPDSILNGLYGYAFMIMIFTFTFVASLVGGSKKALAVSGFVTTVFSIMLYRILDLNPAFIFALVILTIVGLIGAKEEQI
jgi:hypothetical protein